MGDEVSDSGVFAEFETLAARVRGRHAVIECDAMCNRLVERFPFRNEPLLIRNAFRVRHAAILPKTRPRVLTGPGRDFGNFHSLPLLRVADAVVLTHDASGADRADHLHFRPPDRFIDVLKQLPEGFEPDLFWLRQVDSNHIWPQGVEEVPFPTAASACHMFYLDTLQHICRLFDVVAPLSRAFRSRIARICPGETIDLPFGGNWGSFDVIIGPKWEKTVDVAVTFDGAVPDPLNNDLRTAVVDRIRRFKAKVGDRYDVVITSGLSKRDYIDLLRESRIVVNVVGVHGPYNYRTCEAMNAGALLMQLEVSGRPVDTTISDYFRVGSDLVTFDLENLEETLVYYLEHREEAATIARQGWQRLTREYSYEGIYRQLVSKVMASLPGQRVTPSEGLFHWGMLCWHQPAHLNSLALFGLGHVLQQPILVKQNNLMVLLPRLMRQLGIDPVLGQIASEVRITRAFRRGPWEGVQALYEAVTPTLVTEWHHTMLALELGRATPEMLQKTVAALIAAAGNFDFDPVTTVFQGRIMLPGETEATVEQRYLAELLVPLLASTTDAQDMEVRRQYMLRLCERGREVMQA